VVPYTASVSIRCDCDGDGDIAKMPAASAVEVLHKCKWWRTQGYNMHKG